MIKRFLPFIFAVACGIMALAAARGWYVKQVRELQEERARLMADYRSPVEVIVAGKDLPEGTQVTAADLMLAKVPEKFVQPYATSRGNDVVGLVTIAPIAAGEQVLLNKLRRASEVRLGQTLSGVTPEGKRAVTIGTDALTGVGGFVAPGDTIDILWTVQVPGQQGAERVTFVLFQDVPVLAVGVRMVGSPQPQGGAGGPSTVTLALSPQETSLLMYARAQGRIELSLRPSTDTGKLVAVAPASSRTLMETILGPQARMGQAKPAERQIEVFRGLERSVIAVRE